MRPNSESEKSFSETKLKDERVTFVVKSSAAAVNLLPVLSTVKVIFSDPLGPLGPF